MSKSAKKRAAKAARDAAYADGNPGAPAAAKPAEAPKESAPKAAAKKAAAQPAPAKADAKAQAKPAAKKKAQDDAPLRQQQQQYKENPDGPPVEWDDGQGGEWGEVKKGPKGKEERQQRKKEREDAIRKEEERQEAEKMKKLAQDMKAADGGKPNSKAAEALRLADEALQKVKAGKADREDALKKAKEAMAATTAEKVETSGGGATVTGSYACTDERKVGRLIGPKGSMLKMIIEKTGVDKIDTAEMTFTVVGKDSESVNRALAALRELHDKGFTTLAYDNFDEVTVNCSTSYFPDIIGKNGAVIRVLKEKLGVEVTMPNVGKNAPGKHPIRIAGEKAKAEQCKEVIESIMKYYHHDLTHEGMAHQEIEVPEWAYSFIIGKGGSEMKHIQKNWDVKVYIPRETSENPNVVIVGAAADAERAKQYVEKLVAKAKEGPTGGRGAADKADDHWGNEEHEPWMDQYMYKRNK